MLDVLKIFSVDPARAAINIFGGFLVTQRMLAMYKKKKKDKWWYQQIYQQFFI